VSILGGLSTRALVFGTPLWFGLAHAHHALDQWKKGGKTRPAAVRAVLGSRELDHPVPVHALITTVLHDGLIPSAPQPRG
jgi:hypothetical protein